MPASYPASVASFTTRTDDTDTIFAAHVNALQEEVVAIETALGTAPTNSTARSTNYGSVDARLEALETDYLIKTGGTLTGDLLVDKTNVRTTITGTSEAIFEQEKKSATSSGDVVAVQSSFGLDSGSNRTKYFDTAAVAVDNTNGSEDGRLDFYAIVAGTRTRVARFGALTSAVGAGVALDYNRIWNTDLDRFLGWITGSPEGVVTGSIGSVVLQTDGTTGTTLWVKESGTGNTGWKKGGSKTLRVAHGFTIPGSIAVPSGDTDYVPGFYVELPTGQTATATHVRGRVNGGTSATARIEKNGSAMFTASAFTTTAGDVSVTSGATLADNDYINVVVTSVSGSPKNLSLTFYVDYTF